MNTSDSTEAIFVYGSLRSGELAHRQLESIVGKIEPADLRGYRMYVRDGLPFIADDREGMVRGEVITAARPGTALLEKIRSYEPRALYAEQRVRVRVVGGEEIGALAFVGKSPNKGHAVQIQESWSSADDPLFRDGLDGIFRQARVHLETVKPMPADMNGFWEAFLPIQGLYLTLCTVLERYTSLVFGPGLEPGVRLNRLKDDPAATRAAELAKPPQLKVIDSRKPDQAARVPGRHAFDAWYRVRSNLSHRGKAAYTDFELIERGTVGPHDTLRLLLASELPLSEPDRQAYTRRMLLPVYIEHRGYGRVGDGQPPTFPPRSRPST